MNKLNALIQELKENNQDFEFYPTTKEMIKTIYRAASGEDWLDIGCGTCNHNSGLGKSVELVEVLA